MNYRQHIYIIVKLLAYSIHVTDDIALICQQAEVNACNIATD